MSGGARDLEEKWFFKKAWIRSSEVLLPLHASFAAPAEHLFNELGTPMLSLDSSCSLLPRGGASVAQRGVNGGRIKMGWMESAREVELSSGKGCSRCETQSWCDCHIVPVSAFPERRGGAKSARKVWVAPSEIFNLFCLWCQGNFGKIVFHFSESEKVFPPTVRRIMMVKITSARLFF